MDLHLRCIATHPRAGGAEFPTAFAFSSRHPRLVTAAADLLIDQSTSSNALHAVIRLSSHIERLVYVGGSGTFLAFLENGSVSSYTEHTSGLRFVEERRIGGAERTVVLAEGAKFGRFALFAKVDSPSLWCLPVADGGAMGEPYKLRSDIEGDQDNVNFVGGMMAKVRGKVATKAKNRVCPIAAVATHPTLSFVAAAYTNGYVRVWDIGKKEQRSHFDVQLLMGEKVIDIAMDPSMAVVVVCTNQGRILSFLITSALYKRGDEAALPTSKTKIRKRRFQAMCFLPGSPSYLLLLTASKRILVRRLDKSGMVVNSSRYPKASRTLSATQDAVISNAQSAALEHRVETSGADDASVPLLCEPAFGLIATILDNTGNVYVFQPRQDGLPAIRKPITCGLDTGFSLQAGNSYKGPVLVNADALIVQRGSLLSYELGSEQARTLCRLPPGDAHRIEVARDEYGYCIAALIFYTGDDEVQATYGYSESEPTSRYVLCTKSRQAEPWNASEPGEGRSGCFLNAPGQHDQIMILGIDGSMASVLSFVGSQQQETGRQVSRNRGVQRFKLGGKRALKVFRTPFASWTAVLYHDPDGKRLCISKNAFMPPQEKQVNIASEFEMDEGTSFSLFGKEVVIDVRWQRLPTNPEEHYIGAIMTDKRIYFVRDVLHQLSVFEFQRVERIVVPFAPPSFSWMGPSVLMLFGNSLLSVTLDGRSDLIAGVSHGENVTALIATLPDKVVFARPSPTHALNSISISARPYSALSGLVRGMLSLPVSRDRNSSHYVEKVQHILQSQDVSQGSLELTKALIRHELAPIAYLLAVSDQGKHSMPPLRRAAFLGQIGDIRGALAIAESEYARLPDADSFHDGTELYRLLQRILNLSFATRVFGVGKRCSTLLGRKGTFSAFVDMEGGYAAIRSIAEHARVSGNHGITEVLGPLIEKSAKSSVATDSAVIPSQREIDNIGRAIQAVNMQSLPLGTEDKCQVFMNTAPGKDDNGEPLQVSRFEIPSASPTQISERLELFSQEISVELITSDEEAYNQLSGDMEAIDMNVAGTPIVPSETHIEESVAPTTTLPDDEDLFNTASRAQSESVSGAGTQTDAEISQAVKERARETQRLLAQQRQVTSAVIVQGKAQTHELLELQRNAPPTGRAIPSLRAREMLERGLLKLDEGRLPSAGKELDSALRTIHRGQQRGDEKLPAELIHELVYYKLFLKMRGALDKIRTSEHSNTSSGRATYLQLATAATSIPLRPAHRVAALMTATDANILVGNFGTAAHAMRAIKDLGVPTEEMRGSLRDKYAACTARRFVNAAPQGVSRVCFHSLRSIGAVRELRCLVCPARFLTDVGVSVGSECSSCTIGSVMLLA